MTGVGREPDDFEGGAGAGSLAAPSAEQRDRPVHVAVRDQSGSKDGDVGGSGLFDNVGTISSPQHWSTNSGSGDIDHLSASA
jgi:hypothetical protein